jgi:hypothetical protein
MPDTEMERESSGIPPAPYSNRIGQRVSYRVLSSSCSSCSSSSSSASQHSDGDGDGDGVVVGGRDIWNGDYLGLRNMMQQACRVGISGP